MSGRLATISSIGMASLAPGPGSVPTVEKGMRRRPAVRHRDRDHAVNLVTVTNVVRDGCRDQSPVEPAIGPTVDDLAAALSNLAPFEVTSPPSDVKAFGYQGKHLVLRVPNLANVGEGADRQFRDCTSGVLHSWISPVTNSFYGYNGEPGRTEEFWILDVYGTRLVIATNTSPDASPADVAEIDAIVDSIRIQP